jgi:hypothetical protein
MRKSIASGIMPETAPNGARPSKKRPSLSKRAPRRRTCLDDILDFSFVEVLTDERRVVETGGSCCSCS